MAKRKNLNYKEMNELLRNYDRYSTAMKEGMASQNNMSVAELKQVLETNCYAVRNLGINQMKALRKDIKSMSAEEIKVVERVNDSTIVEIISILDAEISGYEEDMKKQRAFNKAWKIRQAEIQQQLIDEGIDKVGAYGCLNINFMEHQKRMAEAQVELAKEIGLHFTKYDPFIGVIEA